ncbi:MAG: hypothetical protein R2753_07005 [Chitinophagales bacterium]
MTLSLGSCKSDVVEEVAPRNYFYGVADGFPFSNTSPKLYKDKEDLFTFIGRGATGVSIFAVINGRDVTEYPATQGELLTAAQNLDEISSLDSNFAQTAILLIAASLETLPVGESFTLLFSQGKAYYSNRGSVTINQYDGSINRLYGDFDVEVLNIIDGTQYIQATFEDLFFTDCPDPGLCFL